MDKFSQALDFRHACKIFDNTKKIPENDINYILDAGRKSPSSFGLEPWHFVVIKDEKIKEELKSFCYNQNQITSCSHVIIVLYRKQNNFTVLSKYLREAVKRNLSSAKTSFDLDAACQYFINYSNSLPVGTTIEHWSEMQCYIPCANMMTAAAYLGIDSCAIGGFEADKITQTLEKLIPKFSHHDFGVTLCLTFGYRKNPQPDTIRWPIESITTFI